jgi:two-component system alkaline phosphatase synthesis response regulator PhoP
MLGTVMRRLRRNRPAAAPAVYQGPDERPTDGTGAARILVVDDDADLRDAIAFTLGGAGFAVATAADGPAALATIGTARPDLVVLDVMMPGPSGIEVCRQLREDPRTASLPVVLLTARTSPAFRYAGLATGANRHVLKPFDPADLVALVRELLGAD